MFNQFGQRRPFNPSSPQRPTPGQTPSGQKARPQGGTGHQIRPGFLPQGSPTRGNARASSSSMRRIQPDNFTSASPQSQRAALFDQARQQAAQQARFIDPRTDLSAALPGGLTEKQRMDFKALHRLDPLAAQKQLDTYQRSADIRYNKPVIGPQNAPGLTHRRPPTSFNGPRRSFGA